jgi:hypothetical protein
VLFIYCTNQKDKLIYLVYLYNWVHTVFIEVEKYKRAKALNEIKLLCKEFGFAAGVLKGSLAEGRKKK